MYIVFINELFNRYYCLGIVFYGSFCDFEVIFIFIYNVKGVLVYLL